MKRVILIIGLWVIINTVTLTSFAQTSTESVNAETPGENDGFAVRVSPQPVPEMKCGNCSEGRVEKVEAKPAENSSPSSSASPADSNIKGEQATPKPSIKDVVKPKPIITPSPSHSPSASPSALIIPSAPAEPYFETYEEEPNSVISNVWNWIKNIFIN